MDRYTGRAIMMTMKRPGKRRAIANQGRAGILRKKKKECLIYIDVAKKFQGCTLTKYP